MEASTRGVRLRWLGGTLVLLGVVLFFVAAGFPPGFTTTYEYGLDGTTTSTSPGYGEVALYVGLMVVGGVLLKASDVVES